MIQCSNVVGAVRSESTVPKWRNFVILAAFGLVRTCSAASLADFTKCIGPQGVGPVCQLDAGTYPLSTQLYIGRSNITTKGTVLTSASDTVLQRAPGFVYSLIIDVSPPSTAPPVSNITIRDLTFDGNRSQNTQLYSSYFAELNVNTTRSILITNCRFINSPFIGVTILGRGANGIVVNNSYFGNAVVFGLWAGAAGNNAGQTYLGCSSTIQPDNIVVANSQFESMGENAIYASATHLQLINNIFIDSHQYVYRQSSICGWRLPTDAAIPGCGRRSNRS